MRRLSGMTAALALLMGIAGATAAQDPRGDFDPALALSSLDPRLTRDADAVVLWDLRRFEVHGPGSARQMVRRAVAVLNAEGREKGSLHIFYDGRLRRLRELTGRITDPSGQVVRRLGRGDQEDESAIPGYSLYDDERVRVARLFHDAYPYAVEFEYEIQHDGLLNWPTWYPEEAEMPVVFGRFELVTAPGVDARYLVRGDLPGPEVSQDGERTVLWWEVREEPAVRIEPFGPAWQDQVMAVHTAPTTFEVEGVRGDMRSWQALGQWYHTLNEGRAVLPPDARRDVHRITDGLSDAREKARRLYAYMQERTRYVSIQLGLGGWQSFDAASVHELGYGDCKALTNYMRALLDETGISSFPALVRAGNHAREVLPDFPSNQFNHVILFVELGDGEEVWLESTDQTIPFGHLGTFTEGRHALLVRPEGGELVETPRTHADQNRRVLDARVRLAPSGEATVEIQTRHTGNEQDAIRQNLARRSRREREQWLFEYLDVPGFGIVNADFSAADEHTTSGTLSMTLTVPRFASRTGRRLFVPTNILHRWAAVPPDTEERTQAIEFFSYAFTHADTIRFEIPAGFTVEALPEPIEVETPFLRYTARAEAGTDGTFAYYRWVEVKESILPPEQYDRFRDSMRQIADADRAQAVLVAP